VARVALEVVDDPPRFVNGVSYVPVRGMHGGCSSCEHYDGDGYFQGQRSICQACIRSEEYKDVRPGNYLKWVRNG